MALKPATLLAALALASTLAGCGAGGMSLASLQGTSSDTLQAKDYYSVRDAQRVATTALRRYDDLRDEWMRAYSDREKDRIEDRMISALAGGISDVRRAVSAQSGASGADSRRIYDIADRASVRYERLRDEWRYTGSISRQREIANEMMVLLIDALKRVKDVSPYDAVEGATEGAAAPKQTIGDRLVPPTTGETK
ncbi:hypothetical protein J7643_10715 [bacterium]|nr:hypothetical protein [bacterium]